jgi:hypothetical protein
VGETQVLPLQALKSNVLCQRHNSAWSQLDQTAGNFFRALRGIYSDLNRNSLSGKPIWHLFSGEELELWLLKTILGFFHAGILTKDREKITNSQTIMNSAIEEGYQSGSLIEPCGMFILKNALLLSQLGQVDFVSLSDEHNKRVVGCRLTMMGLVATLITDPRMLDRDRFEEEQSYRPEYLLFRNGRRRHSILLTWPKGCRSRRAVDFTMHPRPANSK